MQLEDHSVLALLEPAPSTPANSVWSLSSASTSPDVLHGKGQRLERGGRPGGSCLHGGWLRANEDPPAPAALEPALREEARRSSPEDRSESCLPRTQRWKAACLKRPEVGGFTYTVIITMNVIIS